jgi:putative ABC transport system permease protein
MIQDYFKIAWKSMRTRKLRSWLTMIGIVISIAVIFILISLSLGLRETIDEQFKQLGSDKFFIQAKGQAGAPGSGGAVQLTLKDANVVEKVSGVKAILYYNAGNAKIESHKEIRYYLTVGVPTEQFDILVEISNLKLDEGRFFKQDDSGKIILGSQYKSGWFSKPIQSGDTILLNEKSFKVVGILKTVGNSFDDKNIYMTFEDSKNLYNSGDRIDFLGAQVNSGENVKDVAEKAKRKLMDYRNVNEKNIDFIVSTPEEVLSSFNTILNILTGFLVGIAAISLLVGGIGIMNTTYTSILERTKEIGTMKAIGARNSDILLIFLIESGLLGLVGGLIGVILGFGGAKIVEYIVVNYLGTNLIASTNPAIFIGCLGFSFLVGMVSGFIPSYQASRMKPVDALRYE